MAVNSDTGWERKMPGFDGVIAVVYADVHGFVHPFLAVVENLRALFGGLEYACWRKSLVREQVLFFPSQVSNLGGESVREGESEESLRKTSPAACRGGSKKGRTTPLYLESLKLALFGDSSIYL